jgi:hypothetical protein
MNEKDRMNRLREVLRRGDPGGPGGGEAGLTDEEALTMRRTVLSAVPERRERFRIAPVFFTAAAAVLSCVVGFSLWWMRDQPVRIVQPIQTAQPVVPAPQAAPQIQTHPEPFEVAVVAPQERPRPMRPMRSMRPRDSMKHPSSAPDRPVEETPAEESQETTTRQVQFSAPGGTRIIWLLTTPQTEGD